MSTTWTKFVGIIKQMKLFDYIVHYQAWINFHFSRFRRTLFFSTCHIVLYRILTLVTTCSIQIRAISVFFIHNFDLLAAIIYNVSYIYTLLGIDNQHLINDVKQFVWIPRTAQRRIISFDNLLKEVVERHLFSLILKWTSKRTKFVRYAP